MADARAEPPAIREELRVGAVARGQSGVVTTAHLLVAGVTRSAISRRVANGRLHRKYRGVYAVGRPDLSPDGELLAAVLAVGEDAVISHLTAAIAWGFWRYSELRAPFDVLVPRRLRKREDIRVHITSDLPAGDRTRRNGVPITTPVRTLADLATVAYSDHAYRRAVHEAQVQRLVSQQQLQAMLDRRRCPRLAALLKDGPRPTRSELEDAVDELLTRHGLRAPLTNTGIAGLPDWVEVDFLYPQERLVIEADGKGFHDTAIRRADDHRKQRLIEAHGLRVMRLRWEDAQPPGDAQTIARVRHALGR
jgi:Transcriptional regulator, AbiEi antitoxin/Protein of unknown function (DUF559)/AbiEi antitoxin C-terminal domain